MSDWPAPCVLCGYNGPGFYQLATHPCMQHATERNALLAEVARLKSDLDVVDSEDRLAAKRWEAEAMRAHDMVAKLREALRGLLDAEPVAHRDDLCSVVPCHECRARTALAGKENP